MKYYIDYDRLHRDVLKKRYRASMSQNDVVRLINISRATFFRLSKHKELTMETFLKLLTWLETEPNRYIKKTNETTA